MRQNNKWGKTKMCKDIMVFFFSPNQILNHSCHCIDYTPEKAVVISFQIPLLQTQIISTTPINKRDFSKTKSVSTSG